MNETTAHNLNFRYAIFPTAPQVKQLDRQMKECRIQWNTAVRVRKNLKSALQSLRVEHVIKTVLGEQKQNTQSNRAKAISKLAPVYPQANGDELPILYDLRNLCGKAFEIEYRHLDLSLLSREIEPKLRDEAKAFKTYWKTSEDSRENSPPKRPLYFAFLKAIGLYSGFSAKKRIDRSFQASDGINRASIRFDVSGGGESKFTKAFQPSPEQRRLGNKGEPNFKRRCLAYGYQENADVLRQVRSGWQINLRGMPDGMAWVSILLHRPIPDSKLCRVTVQKEADRWFAVLTLRVSDEVYRLPAPDTTKSVGLDPGRITALTYAVYDHNTRQLEYGKEHYSPLEQSLEKLEAISQKLSRMQGPDRRTKKKASNRWMKLNRQRSKLHLHVKNQRQDAIHNLSRHLVRFGTVAIGEWEPPREIKGRRDVKEGKADEVQSGPKGIVSARREGRDRSIATLRRLTVEKGERSGARVVPYAEEHNTTRMCSNCGELTGPRGDTSIREWTCKNCRTHHDRDQNAAFNILKLALAENGIELRKS